MANFNFNKAIIGGRLTADPELKTTSSGVPVVSFSVAVNRKYSGKNGEEPQADFLNVTAWRQTAEFVSRFFRRGSSICVVGSIQTRSWVDQQGVKKYATEIVADEAMFVDSKSEASSHGGGNYSQPAAYMPEGYTSGNAQGGPTIVNGGQPPKFEEIADDDDLPF